MKHHSTFRQIMISCIIAYQKDDCAANLPISVLCTCSIRMYTLTWLTLIINRSKSVSSTNIFSIFPCCATGITCQGAPVHRIQNTPLINCWVSRHYRHISLYSPVVYGSISRILLPISYQCCSHVISLPLLLGNYFYHILLITPSWPVLT